MSLNSPHRVPYRFGSKFSPTALPLEFSLPLSRDSLISETSERHKAEFIKSLGHATGGLLTFDSARISETETTSSPSMATRIPHLLEQYLTIPPEHAHVLLTSVLGASSNWLVLRYLYSYLQKKTVSQDGGDDEERINVVLVSFMRDFAFWKDGAGRLV